MIMVFNFVTLQRVSSASQRYLRHINAPILRALQVTRRLRHRLACPLALARSLLHALEKLSLRAPVSTWHYHAYTHVSLRMPLHAILATMV